MAPAVAEQALWFVWALGMGAGLALLYDFLRELRRLCPRATVPADLLFLAFTVWTLAYLGLALCHGRLQLFQLLGWGRRVRCDGIESFAAGISLVLESNWKNMEDNLVAAWCSVEKNQKILKISLFNWAQMG